MSPAQRGARYREAAHSGNRIVLLAVERAKAAGFPLVGPEDERAARTLAIERSPVKDSLDVEQRELVLYTRAVEAARLDLADLAQPTTLNLTAIERDLPGAVRGGTCRTLVR